MIGIEEGLDLLSGAEEQESKPVVGAARLLLDEGLDLNVIPAFDRQASFGKLVEGSGNAAVEIGPRTCRSRL